MLHVLLCHAAGGGDYEFKKTFNCMLLCWDLVLPAGIVYPSGHRAVIVTHVVDVIVKLFLCEGEF